MRTDNEIKTFVKQYNPVLSDSEVFMERLQDSLDGVEESRRIRKSAVKNYWTVSIIAFSIGAAIGMFVLFLVIFRPASLAHCRLLIEGVLLRFLAFWPVFLALGLFFVLALVTVPLILSRYSGESQN